ncbi:MAG: vitamin B12 dependent-methionine synthase activation domain-containing protein [Planctomycetota bacterium]
MSANRYAIGREVTPIDQFSSLTQAADAKPQNSYLIVGERTNTNGSRQFKRLLQEEDWDGLVSMARDEVKGGAMMIDVCVDFVGRDGVRDMHEVVSRYVRQIPVPLMLDSTDPAVMEAGLKLAGGRCAINSMNLEEGEEKLAEICKLAKKYGASVVAGCIDEDPENAMGRTEQRKIDIAHRIRDLAVEKYGLRDCDLMFDPLVLPISTGIEEDRRNALETIAGTKRIMAELPECQTVVGLSNVGFGLNPYPRQVLNSVFLHELREVGLTGAIAHASKILPKNKIPDEFWDAALDVMYDRRDKHEDPLTNFISVFPEDAGADVAAGPSLDDLAVDEALKQHIIDGEKRDLTKRLDTAMGEGHAPLDIINNILLSGMKVVGDLFGRGEMQLPFVLQSAETMKAAVAHLEPHMEKVEGTTKGSIVLATVKGDVHDIGKNLVDIILTNNGYTVHNIGIKQTVDDILKKQNELKADAIGMSGLLVKSVAVMKDNLGEFNQRNVDVPVLLGGAALTRDYAEDDLATLYGGKVMYCKDAFDGLHVMDAIAEHRLDAMFNEQVDRAQKRKQLKAGAKQPQSKQGKTVDVAKDNPVPTPPFWGKRTATDIPLPTIFGYVNTVALYAGQWGFKKKGLTNEQYEATLADKADPVFEQLKQRALAEGFLHPGVTFGYFPVQSKGDDVIVYDPADFEKGSREPKGKPVEIARFNLPRQDGRRNLCIADFFRNTASGEYDVLGLQCVTMGHAVSEMTAELFKDNAYQDYMYLHGFGVECAEGLAEFWHKRMRAELGFASEDDSDVRKLFQQKYRGSRYSFGYPACPNLEDRTKVLDLLDPDAIGVTLSEEYMLVPEQSTDALVVHHPQAKYFDV